MSDKIKDTEKMNENEEITTEDLDDVAGGKVPVYKKKPGNCIDWRRSIMLTAYGGPDIIPKPLSLEEWKKMKEERKKKEREKKIEQILKLARELDEDRSNR